MAAQPTVRSTPRRPRYRLRLPPNVHPCGPFIIDFFCAERALAIEIDGGQHHAPAASAYDTRTTNYLALRGIRVLRFSADVVLREPGGVLIAIVDALGTSCPSP